LLALTLVLVRASVVALGELVARARQAGVDSLTLGAVASVATVALASVLAGGNESALSVDITRRTLGGARIDGYAD